jgi:threonine aldolase
MPANFGSDNSSGVHPSIIEALVQASVGTAPAYGADALTKRVESRLASLFECEVVALLLSTGTAANCVGLATLTSSFSGIYAHAEAHIANDESTAPELYTGGARQFMVGGDDAKPDLAELAQKIDVSGARGVHSVQPAVISISNLTELGARFSSDEIAAYSELTRSRGMKLFVDGARFANAVAGGSESPADLTWRAGVDALSFGATKNGAMAAEALVFFNPDEATLAEFHRKRGGHLWSKHRYLAAQFDAYLENDLWLELAKHSNDKMAFLKHGVASSCNASILSGGDGNELFIAMDEDIAEGLLERGHMFYAWPSLPKAYRLVTSFTTTTAEIDEFIKDLNS